MERSTRTRRYVGAALATSLLATVASVGPVSADDVTVSGQSAATITLSLGSGTAAFGSTMTPLGGASGGDGDFVSPVVPAGACYEIANTVLIESNTLYQVDVSSNVTNANIEWVSDPDGTTSADPASYADCTGGFPIIIAAGGDFIPFDLRSIPTTVKTHNFYLGLTVDWVDAIGDATLGAAVLTVTAQADA